LFFPQKESLKMKENESTATYYGICCVCETTQPISKMRGGGSGEPLEKEGNSCYEVNPHNNCNGSGTIPQKMYRMVPSVLPGAWVMKKKK